MVYQWLTKQILFLIPIAIIQAIVFQLFQYTYLDWYFFTVNAYSGRYFTLSLFVKSIAVAFTLMLIFFLFGLWKEIKEKDQLTVLRLHKFLFLTISSSIPIFV